jgi:hypothetical protein
MICDHVGCRNTPMRAPRVVVPAKTNFMLPEQRPMRVMTTLHYCELHKHEVKLEDLLNAKMRADIERTAKVKRPLGYRCDFESAFVELVLITTPEYRAFMQSISIANLVREHRE